MLEKDIERKVCQYAKSKGVMPYKFNSMARASVPDRIYVYQGVVLFIEFKQSGKKLTDAQRRELTRLRQQKMPVFKVDNVEDGKTLVDLLVMGLDMWIISNEMMGEI